MKPLLPQVISTTPLPAAPLQEPNSWAVDAEMLLLLLLLATGYCALGIYLLQRWGGYHCQVPTALLLGGLFTLAMTGLVVCYASVLGERHPFVTALGLGSVPGVMGLLYALAPRLLPSFQFNRGAGWLTSTGLYCLYLALSYLLYRAFLAIVFVFVLYILMRTYARPRR